MEQRLGRIVRQGNENPEVEIFRYVTEGTFDSCRYQLVENKQRFISQIMTSKAPARTAEDVDEAVLSYSEIKALATGNPLILEKSNLEMEVGKLNILASGHNSQKYSLEDKVLKSFPKEIKYLEERISAYSTDIETAKAHTPEEKGEFSPMTISGITYTEKKEAGAALIEACKKVKSSDEFPIGTYRGFNMSITLRHGLKHELSLNGALSHKVELSSDIHGNITRINNLIEGFTNGLQSCEKKLENTHEQLSSAKVEVAKPFPHAEELKEKTTRLNELNILLNMDESTDTLLEDPAGSEHDTDVPEGDEATINNMSRVFSSGHEM